MRSIPRRTLTWLVLGATVFIGAPSATAAKRPKPPKLNASCTKKQLGLRVVTRSGVLVQCTIVKRKRRWRRVEIDAPSPPIGGSFPVDSQPSNPAASPAPSPPSIPTNAIPNTVSIPVNPLPTTTAVTTAPPTIVTTTTLPRSGVFDPRPRPPVVVPTRPEVGPDDVQCAAPSGSIFVQAGKRGYVCGDSFDPALPVQVIVRRGSVVVAQVSSGVTQLRNTNRQIVPAVWFRDLVVGDGQLDLEVSQAANGVVKSFRTSVTVGDPNPDPSIFVVWPADGPPGRTFTVRLERFPANTQVPLALFTPVAGGGWQYLTTLTDLNTGTGTLSFELATAAGDPRGRYCIAVSTRLLTTSSDDVEPRGIHCPFDRRSEFTLS